MIFDHEESHDAAKISPVVVNGLAHVARRLKSQSLLLFPLIPVVRLKLVTGSQTGKDVQAAIDGGKVDMSLSGPTCWHLRSVDSCGGFDAHRLSEAVRGNAGQQVAFQCL